MREVEVLRLAPPGLSANEEVAERLVHSRRAVEHHVSTILRTPAVRSRVEGCAWAVLESNQRPWDQESSVVGCDELQQTESACN